jgi:hypothetical protein
MRKKASKASSAHGHLRGEHILRACSAPCFFLDLDLTLATRQEDDVLQSREGKSFFFFFSVCCCCCVSASESGVELFDDDEMGLCSGRWILEGSKYTDSFKWVFARR